jgi:hypothetical protein
MWQIQILSRPNLELLRIFFPHFSKNILPSKSQFAFLISTFANSKGKKNKLM